MGDQVTEDDLQASHMKVEAEEIRLVLATWFVLLVLAIAFVVVLLLILDAEPTL